MPEQTGNVTVRMPVKLPKNLDHIAAGVDRSRNWLINKAVQHYFDVYDWQEQRIRERLKKAEKRGKFYSKTDVKKVVESLRP